MILLLTAGLAGCGDSAQEKCDRLFNDRIGHDVNDDDFWNALQQCARDERLPEGQNDPAFYAE